MMSAATAAVQRAMHSMQCAHELCWKSFSYSFSLWLRMLIFKRDCGTVSDMSHEKTTTISCYNQTKQNELNHIACHLIAYVYLLYTIVSDVRAWANGHTLIGPRSPVLLVWLLDAFLTTVCLWFEIILIWNFNANHNVYMAAKKSTSSERMHTPLAAVVLSLLFSLSLSEKGKLQHILSWNPFTPNLMHT